MNIHKTIVKELEKLSSLRAKQRFVFPTLSTANKKLSCVSYGWVCLCSHALIWASVLSITLPLQPPARCLGYAETWEVLFCSCIFFSAQALGEGQQSSQEARGWALKTAWMRIIAVRYKQRVTAELVQMILSSVIEGTVTTFSLAPVTSHTREAAARSVPAWSAHRTTLKPDVEIHTVFSVIGWGRWKGICCINQEVLDDFFILSLKFS